MDKDRKTITRLFRDSLIKILDREFLIFMFFLILSGAFWLVTVLNDTIEKEVDVPVRLVNIPKGVILMNSPNDTLHVVIRDKGFAIASYVYGDESRTIDIDFKQQKINDDNITVSGNDLTKLIAKSFNSSTKVIQIKPDKLTFYFTQGNSKKVPVRLQGSVKAASNYYLESVKFQPDSVTIYGSDALLKRISYVNTVNTNITDINKVTSKEVRLNVPKGMKADPASVTMVMDADILTEAEVDVPITAENMPEGWLLRTFPARVKIKYVVGTKKARDITPEQFVIQADYNTIVQNPEQKKCPLTLKVTPRSVLRPQMEISEVDYLIEK